MAISYHYDINTDSYISFEPCVFCGHYAEAEVCYHHEYTRKAYPEHSEKKWNLIPTCMKHHEMIHKIGAIKMSEKFPSFKRWLLRNEWFICPIKGCWAHQKAGEKNETNTHN